jgi:hypothetical protein
LNVGGSLDPTDPLLMSFVEVNSEESGGTSSHRCIWMGNGYLTPSNFLTQDNTVIDLSCYPAGADTVSAYVRMLEEFPGEERSIPQGSLSYFFSSAALNVPGRTDMPSQVEADLLRFTSMHFNDTVIYDKHSSEQKITMSENQIFDLLKTDLKDKDAAFHCSQLLTQATLAGPTLDFYQKFANAQLGYSITNQLSTDFVLKTCDSNGKTLKNITLYSHLILGVHDVSDIAQALRSDDLYVQGYCLITRTITIPFESLKIGSTKDGTIEDTYSRFFISTDEVLQYLDALIDEETLPKPPEEIPAGYCIIA